MRLDNEAWNFIPMPWNAVLDSINAPTTPITAPRSKPADKAASKRKAANDMRIAIRNWDEYWDNEYEALRSATVATGSRRVHAYGIAENGASSSTAKKRITAYAAEHSTTGKRYKRKRKPSKVTVVKAAWNPIKKHSIYKSKVRDNAVK